MRISIEWAGFAWFAITVATVLLPSRLDAQVLVGRVLDGSSEAPLPDARIQALAPDGLPVGEPVLSSGNGAFVLALPDTGAYHIRLTGSRTARSSMGSSCSPAEMVDSR